MHLLLMLSGCASWEAYDVEGGRYWEVVPDGAASDAQVLLHLHHSGDGEGLASDEAVRAGLAAVGLIGVFPDGGGQPGDDWNVGINKDDIPRDDTVFLAAVAADLRQRRGASSLWLCSYDGGHPLPDDWVARQADGISLLSR
jgi:poly(3-hydroxybutyrate) depolymerase